MTPAEVRSYDQNPFYKMLADVYSRYETILKTNNAVDFDDLLILVVRLFQEKKDVLNRYREQFKHILVDEYQDTNKVQYMLLKHLSQDKQMVCAVGDDDQSIYAWRGADINNILNFEEDFPKVKVIKLEQNYRSTQPILDAANRLIAQNERRNIKKLWTAKKEGAPVRFVMLDDEMAEAKWVADQIYKWHDVLHRPYHEVSIFYRTHAQSRAFEEVLRGARIPYSIIGGIKFYDRKEVKDLLAYLKVIVNPKDDVCLKRIINVPGRGIGDKTVEKMAAYAQANGISLFETFQQAKSIESVSPKTRSRVSQTIEDIQKWRHESLTMRFSEFIKHLIEELGYFEYLQDSAPGEADFRIQNVEELVSAAADYESSGVDLGEDRGISAYLNEVALLTDVDMTADDSGSISLMTLHAAKGLEFPLVFFTGMEENIFPSLRESDSDYLTELEEERRLCYVGITRAREMLFLTAAQARRMYGQRSFNPPSMFIEEIQPVTQQVRSHSGYRPSYTGYRR